MELFLSESNRLIRINDKINKGIKSMENDKEKNIIKQLNDISKISKNQKEMNNLFQELMKNAKISFEKEKKDIKFEEYYFSGVKIPKNIEFKDITPYSVNIFWKIDNINIKNKDNNKIKFKLEIKKENSKEEFK